jgi:hypothetical protein
MPATTNALQFRFANQFVFTEQPESPEVEREDPGVEIALGRPMFGEDSVGVMIHATVGLDAELFHAFKRAVHAIVVTVEERGSGRAAAFRMVDPNIDYLRAMWPNFQGYAGGEPSPVFARGWVSAPLELRVAPEPGHRGLFIQAHLREHQSRRICLSLAREQT